MAKETAQDDPGVVLDLIESFRRSKTMFAAVSLGVFDALDSGPKHADDLAIGIGADKEALARLLNACVGLRLLQRKGDAYENTVAAATYLAKTSPKRLTGYINFSNDVMWKMWANLEGAVREGSHRWKETFGWDGPIFSHFFRDAESRREFLMGMHGFGLISSPQVVKAADIGRFKTLVDLGGATGHLAISACELHPRMTAVVFDLPEAIPLAQEIVGESAVDDRIALVCGDFFSDPLPEGDIYALGRILHDWTEAKILTLLGRIFERLPHGGAILIAEKLVSDDQSGPRWAQMQDLNMLTCTEGRERTIGEYEALLKNVGFSQVRGHVTSSPLDAVVAIKA